VSCLWGRITSKKGTEIEKVKKILLNIEPNYKNYGSDEFKKIEFDTHYKLEDNEIFYLELIEDVKNLIKNQDILKLSDENSTGYTQLIKEEWGDLDYLIYFKDNNLYYQRVVGKKYLTRKKILIFDTETPVLEEKSEGISINENPDVVYNKGENKIYFKSFTSLNKIFKGLILFIERLAKKKSTIF